MDKYDQITQKFYGRYGNKHCRYLLQNRKDIIDDLLKENKLDNYLLSINNQALELRDNIFEKLKIKYNLNSLLESNHLEFMNLLYTIEYIAEEIVLNDIIYI